MSRGIRSVAAVSFALATLASGVVRADTIWTKAPGTNTKPFERANIKIDKIENDTLFFTVTQSGRADKKPLAEVVKIKLDDDPAFTAAEQAFEAEQWDAATANYQKAVQSSTREWVKTRAGLRLVEAAGKSGNFASAVAGWASSVSRDPAAAARGKPEIPTDKPDQLTGAIDAIRKAASDTSLKPDAKRTLLTYLLELQRAKGDSAGAQETAKMLEGAGNTGTATPLPDGVAPPAPAPGKTRGEAEAKLQLAHLSLDNKDYQKVITDLQGAGASFTDPEQQAEALFVMAEARAGLAPADDAKAQKDVALAYMRVVAHCKSSGSARVPEALLKAAAIQEKLKALPDALLLYGQVAEEYKNSDAAKQAAAGAERVKEAMKASS